MRFAPTIILLLVLLALCLWKAFQWEAVSGSPRPARTPAFRNAPLVLPDPGHPPIRNSESGIEAVVVVGARKSA